MGPAGFLLTGAARLPAHDGIVAGAKTLERGLDVIDRFERMKAIAAAAQLPGGLRPAQKQQRYHRLGRTVEMPGSVEIVVPARGPAAENFPDQLLVLKAVERALNLTLPHFHHRLAIRFLIAGGDEGVDRQRVVLGRGQLLLHQTAENANLDRIELARGKPARFALAIEGGDGVGHGNSRLVDS